MAVPSWNMGRATATCGSCSGLEALRPDSCSICSDRLPVGLDSLDLWSRLKGGTARSSPQGGEAQWWFMLLPLSGLMRQMSNIGLTREQSSVPLRECSQESEHQSCGQPQLVVCPTLFQSTTLIGHSLLFPLVPWTGRGKWSLFAEGKPFNQDSDPKGRHILTSLKKGLHHDQGLPSLSRSEQ